LSDLETHVEIARYRAGEISIDDLAEWLDEAALDAETGDLVFAAVRLIAEFEHGDWDEEQLRVQFELINSVYRVSEGAANHADAEASVLISRTVAEPGILRVAASV